MNRQVIAILFIASILTSKVNGQEKEKRLTDAEQFSLKTGILLEREFINIGKFKGIEIQVIKFKDIHSDIKKSVLRFEKAKEGNYSTGSAIVSIDAEEISDLEKAIRSLKTNIFPTTRTNYTDVTFKSKADFEAGGYYSPDKKKWTGYVRLSKYDEDSLVFLTVEDFDSLLMLLSQSKAKM